MKLSSILLGNVLLSTTLFPGRELLKKKVNSASANHGPTWCTWQRMSETGCTKSRTKVTHTHNPSYELETPTPHMIVSSLWKSWADRQGSHVNSWSTAWPKPLLNRWDMWYITLFSYSFIIEISEWHTEKIFIPAHQVMALQFIVPISTKAFTTWISVITRPLESPTAHSNGA